MSYPRMLRHVALARTNVSEVYRASIIRVTRIGELGTILAVTSNRHTLRKKCKFLVILCFMENCLLGIMSYLSDLSNTFLTTITIRNVVSWDIKSQFVLHRRNISSPLQCSRILLAMLGDVYTSRVRYSVPQIFQLYLNVQSFH
jgi:hypothetical protein